MASTGITAKKRHSGSAAFALGCGCRDAKSVSVSASVSPSATGTWTTTTTQRRGSGTNQSASTTTDTLTLTSASSSFFWEDAEAEVDYNDGTPSFSGLLRELNELEQSVVSWGRKDPRDKDFSRPPPPSPPPLPLLLQEHRKVMNSGEGSSGMGKEACYGGGLEGSVAVVKQSEDPLGDFRHSMLQMIVENEIVAGDELRELLRRFLELNAPHHHDVILRAFAEIWDDVFAPAPVSRREPPRLPGPRTPPRHRRSPPAWRV